MKKTLVLIAILSFAKTSFCQRELAEEYKAKSRHFRTGGIILVSVGGAMALTGTALILGDQSNEYYNDDKLSARTQAGLILIAAGITAELGSIPLFVVSGVMHKKASRILRASTFLELEKVPPQSTTGFALLPFPALCVKINL